MRVPDMQGVVFWCVVVLAVLFLVFVVANIFMDPVTDGELFGPGNIFDQM